MTLRAVLAVAASLSLLALASVISRTEPEGSTSVVEAPRGPRAVVSPVGERASIELAEPEIIAETLAEADRSPSTGFDAGAGPADGRPVALRGRCLSEERGEPIAGCQLLLGAGEGRGAVRSTTDEDGRFEARFRVELDQRVSVEFRARGRAVTRALLAELPDDLDVVDLGDVRLVAGGVLLAHVVTEAGEPVSGVDLRFVRETMAPNGVFRFASEVALTTDINGRVETDGAIACGAWRYELPRHLEVVEPEGALEVGPSGSLPFRIVVARPDPSTLIEGLVVDPESRPVARASVTAVDERGRRVASATADDEGRFALVRWRTADEAVRIRARSSGAPELRSRDEARHTWGTQGVELRVLAVEALALRLQTQAAEPLSPVEVSWALVESGDVASTFGRETLEPDGNVVSLSGLPVGRIRLAVESGDPLAGTSEIHVVPFDGSASMVDVSLLERVDLEVNVRFADGSPAARTQVEVLEPYGAAAIEIDTHATDLEHLVRTASTVGSVLRWGAAETGSDGVARVPCGGSERPLVLRLSGAEHLPKLVRGVRPGGAPVDVVVSRGATVEGSIGPLVAFDRTVGPRGPHVVFTYAGDESIPAGLARRSSRVTENGGYRVSGLHAGRWVVQLRSSGFGRLDAPGASSAPFAESFGTIDLAEDDAQDLDLSVAHLVPATMRGHVVVDGAPLCNAEFQLVRIVEWDGGGVSHADVYRTRTMEDGSFLAEALRPGRYLALVEFDGGELIAPDFVSVAADSEASKSFLIDAGYLSIRLVDEAGEPMGGVSVVVENLEVGYRSRFVANDEGLVESPPLAATRYTIRGTRSDGAAFEAGEVLVPTGPAGPTADVTARALPR